MTDDSLQSDVQVESKSNIFVINAGSSSIKFSWYTKDDLKLRFSGQIKNIGTRDNTLTTQSEEEKTEFEINTSDTQNTIKSFVSWLSGQSWFSEIMAIGHRIVHGMEHTQPVKITHELWDELFQIIPFDPDHLTLELGIVKALKQKHPDLPQVACFDTSFHTTIPDVASRFAIPEQYAHKGVKRYGFHGISYAYLMSVLQGRGLAGKDSRVILAHLGNGASLAAVKDGKCIDTSMGMTPAGGIVMSTRSGDLDPGVAWFLLKQGMSADEFNTMINKKSGLLGLSAKSGDMKYLLDHRDEDSKYAMAIDVFCYQLKKFIGAYIAALGGLDILVFSGGIGEHAPAIRAQVCEGLRYAGIVIDAEKNSQNQEKISAPDSDVQVLVIPTDEEIMVARDVKKILKN